MPASLSLTLAILALLHAGLELVLAARALAWLRRRHDGRVLAVEGGKVRLLAARALAESALAAAAALGGAAALAELAGPILCLPAALLVLAVLELPFAAWDWRLNTAVFARLGRDLAVTLPPAALVGWAAWGEGWAVAAWAGLAAALLARELGSPGGRRLSPAPAEFQTFGHAVLLSDEGGRSGRLNARAEGLGRWRRIVVNAGVVETLAPDQAAAVVAHEAGHLRHRHREMFLAWRLGLAAAALAAAMALVEPGLPAAAALTMLLLALPVIRLPVRPLETRLIRRWEDQADRHAAETAGAGALADALERLYGANATAARPEPLWAAFHHPHPPPADRLERLRAASREERGQDRLS